MKRIDMAVDRQVFPPVKKTFNPQGERRFLYIGKAGENKGTDYLDYLARLNSNIHFGWVGTVAKKPSAVKMHGYINLASSKGREILGMYDFLLTCGRSDANPTTILEGAAAGLIPVCTPQSGYVNEDWVINIPLNNAGAASAILQDLQVAQESRLLELQQNAKKRLESHFTWERFGEDVATAIQSPPAVDRGHPQWKTLAKRNRELLARFSAMTPCSQSAGRRWLSPQKWIKAVVKGFTHG
ncbi:MAG: glycosyltransferase [Lentisphaeria bacterium]|nr:glycosyltransferase [Lentisphaeria bacterium]